MLCDRDPVEVWLAARPRVVERIDQTMTDFRAATTVDLAMLTVASRRCARWWRANPVAARAAGHP